MREELEHLLYERYPAIFAGRHPGAGETRMIGGIACGDGWLCVLDTLCGEIERQLHASGAPQVVAVQVKEKFGGLRFYVRGGDAFTDALIWIADLMSGFICDVCGLPGRRSGGPFVRTRCPEHGGAPFKYDPRAEEGLDMPLGAELEAWRAADAFHLPPIESAGWRHLAYALELSIRNDIRVNKMPPPTIREVDEHTGLHFEWDGGDDRGRLAGMIRLVEAYSARCDRHTGAPIVAPPGDWAP